MTQKVITNDEAVTGSNFFAIFGTFGRYVTNLGGTSVENQPTLLCSVQLVGKY
jgi:hypothetical protein